MKVVGVISEYNPFHEGHAHLLEQAKKISGADFAVSIMNGDFVQRGEPAILDKYTRTRMALEGGSDMVFELPVRFGISSASDFAMGGMLAIQSLGFVTDLCFGSESGDLELFHALSETLFTQFSVYIKELQANMRAGMSYPAAFEKALRTTTKCPEDFLNQPNNILGVQYCLALQELHSDITVHTIKRIKQEYHEHTADTDGHFYSATALRNDIKEKAERHLCLDDFSDMIGYALRNAECLDIYKDISPHLADRMQNLLPDYHTASSYVKECLAKNYTEGRIRRSLLQCLFSLTKTDMEFPYLRLLGMKKEAACLLHDFENTTNFHIVSHLAADIPELSGKGQQLIKQDLLASDLYRQIWCRKYDTTLPNEFQHSPVIL